MLSRLLLTMVLATAACASAESVFNPLRSVTGGNISGFFDSTYNVAQWLGIPFAAPPTGSLRFVAPAPVVSWSGVLSTIEFQKGCLGPCGFPHPNLTCAKAISEDCLYLNVYSPSPSPVSSGGLPVVFWIPGGRYQFGTAGCKLYDGRPLASTQQIVLVTASYRLGAFGGLATSSGIAGNFQLQDQRAAMRWVKQNIAQFGGDPTRVTIFGQSAGAMSVGAHLASPNSKGLFQAAAMSSNPFGVPFQNEDYAHQMGEVFLSKVGCSNTADLASQLSCLQQLDPFVILNASQAAKIFPWPSTVLADIVPWTPVVGASELPKQPIQYAPLVSPDIPVLMGNNANDSVLFVGEFASSLSFLEADGIIAYVFGIENAIKLSEMYADLKAASPNGLLWFSRIATDYLFTCANRHYARTFAAAGGKAYLYLMNFLPSINEWFWAGSDYPICVNYTCHGDDLPYWFNVTYLDNQAPPLSPSDMQAVRTFQDTIGGFAHRGAPNVKGWEPVSSQNGTGILKIGSPLSAFEDGYHSSFCDFYDSIGYSRR